MRVGTAAITMAIYSIVVLRLLVATVPLTSVSSAPTTTTAVVTTYCTGLSGFEAPLYGCSLLPVG